MCGIFGFFGFARTSNAASHYLRAMGKCLRHRGPNDEGYWEDCNAQVALGQCRLSIIDLSPAGHQPMVSESGRYVITFNGEIYNYRQLRDKLDQAGTRNWYGHCDTEVLVAAIERWGTEAALAKCVGMYALAVWDRKERTLSLARDRIGEKPLYYGRIGNTFAFASELKALTKLPNWSGEIDRNSLTLMMRHCYVPAPYSIYRGIEKLRPGHLLVVGADNKTPHVGPYWSAHDAAQNARLHPFAGSPDEAVDELDRLLRRALDGQMIADVPLGAFLSGGIDSSTVVAVMQSMSPRPVKTFSIGFHERDYNEAEHAKAVASHLGTDHTELYVTEREALDIVPSLPRIYCEPFADSSQIPTYLVALLARQHVTVALSGDGGDELFSGYSRYALPQTIWKTISRLPLPLRRMVSRAATLASPALYDRITGPAMRFVPKRLRRGQIGDRVHKAAELLTLDSVCDVYKRLCSDWTRPEDLVLGGREMPTMLTGLEPLPDLAGDVERMMYTDLLSYLPDDILVKVDRAAMAASLETRMPYLDHRIVEFAMSLPITVLRAEGVSKWPVREIVARHVPRSLFERPKMGFGVPIESWLRGVLRDWAEDLLSENRLQSDGFFNPGSVRQAWDEHLSGRRNNQYLLWNVLMFQSWLQAKDSAGSQHAA